MVQTSLSGRAGARGALIATFACCLLHTGVAAALPSPVAPASTVASAPRGEQADEFLAAYDECTQLMRSGHVAAAVDRILAHDAGWVSRAAAAFVHAVRASDRRFDPLDIEAAVLLHIDAFQHPSALPSLQSAHATAALDIASTAGRLPPEFVRDAHLLVVWALQRLVAVEDLVVQLGRALRRFPDDPDLLLAQGSLWETLKIWPDGAASLFPQTRAIDEIRGPGAWARSDLVTVRLKAPQIYEACARVFERALGRAPDLHEARLRLGRVLGQAGRHDQAAKTLEPLLAQAGLTPRERYFAGLFHGRAMLALGRPKEALSSFRVAQAAMPGCQTAGLAAGVALRAAGDAAAAREAIAAMLLRPGRTECDDPWWSYVAGQAWRADPLSARLHEEVRR